MVGKVVLTELFCNNEPLRFPESEEDTVVVTSACKLGKEFGLASLFATRLEFGTSTLSNFLLVVVITS